ncbi:AMP-binding protein [Streptomyces sp. B15]|uniref:AMP-binding protein n=1 Tax=Streptomyces sp. B15 TaxID=1537797 RepID=UPI001B3651F1|nr:AMP-binding protein [Streptomyces sp. B15]MBQ1121042.1 AMP-binding protein [Streptomyces sp. B15]
MAATGTELWDLLLRDRSRGVLHHWDGEDFGHTPWREVVQEAHGMAATLRAAGVHPGTRVATVLTNSAHTVRGLLAIWLAGGAVASFPLPARGQTPEEYGSQLTRLTERLDAAVLLTDEAMVPLVPAGLAARLPVLTWTSLYGDGHLDPSPPGPEEIAFVQYSSGSTSLPKGCALTSRAIATHLQMLYGLADGRVGAETIVSWLPLSHDMGIFGTLLNAWAFDYDFVLSSPERFGMAPRTWFRDMSRFGATMSAGTNTALYLAARAQGSTPLPKPLALKVFVVGAERVDTATLETTMAAFGPSGLSRAAFMPAYGMAEATLAVASSPTGQDPVTRSFEAAALVDGEVVEVADDAPGATQLVSNGPPLPGVTVTTQEPGRVSQLLVSSPSLASGYLGDPERTAERFRDGVLHTGDLGFVHKGEVYFVGRADDLISVGGRNVYTSEIESAIEALGPVRKGCSALVDVADGGISRLVLLLEPKRRSDDFRLIAGRAATVAREKSGIALAECVFVERGHLPRTPSGKIQRFRCRAALGPDGGELKTLARVPLG